MILRAVGLAPIKDGENAEVMRDIPGIAVDYAPVIDWGQIIEDGVRAYDNQVVGQTISPWLLGGLALMIFASK